MLGVAQLSKLKRDHQHEATHSDAAKRRPSVNCTVDHECDERKGDRDQDEERTAGDGHALSIGTSGLFL